VLAVVSNPIDLHDKYDLPQADVAAEIQSLREALAPLQGQVQLDVLDEPITLKRLEAKLREGYHLLHLVAHGAFNQKNQHATVYLQNDDGTAQRVIDSDFTAMLARLSDKPALVVLAACQSATRSMNDAFIGLGPQLVQGGIPAVIAMQDFVTVVTARQFSATLYEQLLKHGRIDRAVNEARATLLTVGRYDAAVPVLFMRLKDGRLLEVVNQSGI
jgi:CHAT domain-containing protein